MHDDNPSRAPVAALFLDIGGVLLTNGWDHEARRRAAETFGLDRAEMEERHALVFGSYEEGKASLDEYLERVVFHCRRPFSPEQFASFMFAQSRPFPEMIGLVRGLKARWGLKVAAVSNEGRELATYRITHFGLGEFVDFFVVSSFVHLRKPDPDMYRLALDLVQVPPAQVAYVEDRPILVEVAASLGIHAIWHRDRDGTATALAALGLAPGQ